MDADTTSADDRSPERLEIRYRFTLADGTTREFPVELDAGTFRLAGPLPDEPPSWTALEFEQCPHCPLEPETDPQCPAAVSIAPLVEAFDALMSFEKTRLEVETAERTVVQEDVSVQHALRSLMGLVMAVSGCPYTAFFRPMARFHLPLASREETVYRAASSYLLAQYFRHLVGLEPDFDLAGLTSLYEDVQVLNRAMADRLKASTSTDSSVNAVISLDTLAMFLPMAVAQSLAELEPLFARYVDDAASGDA